MREREERRECKRETQEIKKKRKGRERERERVGLNKYRYGNIYVIHYYLIIK